METITIHVPTLALTPLNYIIACYIITPILIRIFRNFINKEGLQGFAIFVFLFAPFGLPFSVLAFLVFKIVFIATKILGLDIDLD